MSNNKCDYCDAGDKMKMQKKKLEKNKINEKNHEIKFLNGHGLHEQLSYRIKKFKISFR